MLAGCGREATSLPLVTLPPGHSGPQPLVLLLSGDGNWGAFMRDLGGALSAAGLPVLGLDSRTYFCSRRTPAEVSRDLAGAVRHYLRAWQRDSLVLVGYSRGADVLPFVFNRWPADLQRRVQRIALVGMHEYAGFRFFLPDLLFEIHWHSDVPVRPELRRITGTPLLCVRGEREHRSLCAHPPPAMSAALHDGGHVVRHDSALVRLLVAEVAGTRAARNRLDGHP